MIKKILIAIDDGPTSEKVAANGAQLGKQLNARIALVSVADNFLMTEGGVTPGELRETIKKDLKTNQQLLTDKIFKDHNVQLFVEEGKPYEKILKAAEEWEADLIIIGTHGRTGLSHLLMGSVAEHVVRHSKIPVLIVPSR